ncbi:hypothetical protein ABTG52_19225, partial [Acinetobacter baumannii]
MKNPLENNINSSPQHNIDYTEPRNLHAIESRLNEKKNGIYRMHQSKQQGELKIFTQHKWEKKTPKDNVREHDGTWTDQINYLQKIS